MLSNLKSLKRNKSLISTFRKDFSWGIFNKIKRHFDAILEPHHREIHSSVIDTNLAMYTTARTFQSYLTKNAYDMAVFNEYDLWPHTNFGTIDNPLIIFSADASWRTVICSGPGSEEESSSHEKMTFIIREGPIHRCQFCGQCFKLLRLKDSPTDEKNYYYSSVFTEISFKQLVEIEHMPAYTYPFTASDFQTHNTNPTISDTYYVFVNADEADHLMVDPAKRLELYKELEEDFLRMNMAIDEIKSQQKLLRISDRDKLIIPRDIFERWTEVERAIYKFDRVFNRYEKFHGRSAFDPVNHERRERRMMERKEKRENDNYTYYFGGLTEEEQMFRDYYETDLEEYPDSESIAKLKEEAEYRGSGDFDLKYIELVEPQVTFQDRLPVQDIIDKSLFKYKYRSIADPKYNTRSERVISRFIERAKNRDPRIFENFHEKIENFHLQNDTVSNILDLIKTESSKGSLSSNQKKYEDLMPYARYVAEEGLQQFKDYYETDEEEGIISRKAEYYNDLNEANKLKFISCYENPLSKNLELENYYVSIPKRPYDNKKSIVSNFVEDLIDFNNRVRPIQRSLIFMDQSSIYQGMASNPTENQQLSQSEERYRKILNYQKTSTNLLDEVKKSQH